MWLERLAADYENLRAALEWCSENPEHVSEGLQIGSSLALFWFIRGPYHEGVRWLEPLLATSTGDRTVVRAGALWGVGLMWTLIGDPERAGRRSSNAWNSRVNSVTNRGPPELST